MPKGSHPRVLAGQEEREKLFTESEGAKNCIGHGSVYLCKSGRKIAKTRPGRPGKGLITIRSRALKDSL